jgi:alpha-1,6-mannosyltransferase
VLSRLDVNRQLTLTCAAAAAGSTAIAASSWWVAAIPSSVRLDPPAVLTAFSFGGAIPRVGYYVGLAVVLLTWLVLGRWLLVDRRSISIRRLTQYIVSVAVPMLFAPPVASRDLWAYAAQGNMLVHAVNPYTLGPSAVPGAFTDEVSPRWVFSPAPYGPFWMQISHGLVRISADQPTLAAMLLRIPSLVGVLLAVWTMRPVAARLGGRVDLGVWMGLASPLALVLGVGGGHNDLLMVGLLVAGLAIVVRGSWSALAVGAVVLGAATVVKSPAVAGVAFAVPIWLYVRRPPGRRYPDIRETILASVVAGAFGVATMVVVTAAAGLGWAWVHEISSDVSVVNWFSVPTALAIVVKLASGHVAGATALDATMRTFRSVASALTGVVLAALWFVALRRAPLRCLVVGLAAAAVLVPAVQPWYYCWALALAGLVVARKWVWLVLMTTTLSSVIMIRPNGQGLQMDPALINIIAGSALACWVSLRAPRTAAPTSPPDHDRAEHAGT